MENKLKVSDQFLGVLMVLLQKSLMEQEDIVPMIKNLELVEENGELIVSNPPTQLDGE